MSKQRRDALKRQLSDQYDMPPGSHRFPLINTWRFMSSGRGMYPDPEGSLSDIVSTNPRTACVNPKVDEMMAAANAEPDMEKRAELLIEVQKHLMEQAYWYVFFNNPLRIEVWKEDVKGYEPLPLLRRTTLRSTWLDR